MKISLSTLVGLAVASTLSPLQAQVPPDAVSPESLFAVITHRGGLAGSLAHNHFVVAPSFIASVTFNPSDPTGTAFHFSTLTDELVVDDPTLQAAWISRIRELELVDNFGNLSEGDRAKVRREMLDPDQLDPEQFPVIAATLVGVTRSASSVGQIEFGYEATLDVTIHGVTVQTSVPVRYEETESGVRIEGVGRFQFEAFGIKPYSAFLGTVKVQNDFEIYVNLLASPRGGP